MNTTTPTTKPDDELELELLATGTHHGCPITVQDLHTVSANHRALADLDVHRVPLAVGHQGHDDPESPAFGWLKSTRVAPDARGIWKLFGRFTNVAKPLIAAIRAKRLDSLSCELHKDWSATPYARNTKTEHVKGYTLGRAACLGGSCPEIKGLSPLSAALHHEAPRDGSLLYIDTPMRSDEMHLAAKAADLVRLMDLVQLKQDSAALKAEQASLMARACALVPGGEAPVKFTGFQPDVAPTVSRVAHALMARTEYWIQRLGLSRNDPSSRRKAVREALLEWKSKADPAADEISSTDVQNVINGFVYSGEDERNKAADKGPEINAIAESLKRQTGMVSKVAPSMAAPILNSEEDVPGFIGGSASAEADRLGGSDRFWRLRALARKRNLDLRRHDDRQAAEAALFSELGSTVRESRTYDEAAAAVTRSQRLSFSAADQRSVAFEVARLRPDLAGEQYGSHARLNADADAVAFSDEGSIPPVGYSPVTDARARKISFAATTRVTAPDMYDSHTHTCTIDENGEGETSVDGEVPHKHAIGSGGEVQTYTGPGNYVSFHPGMRSA